MADLSIAISQMLILLIITAAGYLATRVGYLDNDVKAKLTKLIMNITLPCMIVASAASVDAASVGTQVVQMLVLGALQFFLLLAAGALCVFILRPPREQRIIYVFISIITNTSFVGIPVADALYGGHAVLLCSVFIMSQSILVYTLGFALIAPKTEGGRLRGIVKAVVSPSTLSAVLALVLVFSGVQLPSVLSGALDMIGGITAPLAMMMVGVIIAGMRFTDVLREWRLYPYILIRQFLFPAAFYVLFRPIIGDEMVLGIFTVMFAMPVGSMASMFVANFGHDATMPAKGTILSTLASFAIIPALLAFMAWVG